MKQVYNATFDIPGINRYAVGFDRLFSELQRSATNSNPNYPPYNIVRHSDTNYSIEVAVAGFAEEDLNVEIVDNNILTINGDRHNVETTETEYLHQGIAARNFIRSFTLAEHVEVKAATVKNGILTVNLEHTIPEAAKPRKVAISFTT